MQPGVVAEAKTQGSLVKPWKKLLVCLRAILVNHSATQGGKVVLYSLISSGNTVRYPQSHWHLFHRGSSLWMRGTTRPSLGTRSLRQLTSYLVARSLGWMRFARVPKGSGCFKAVLADMSGLYRMEIWSGTCLATKLFNPYVTTAGAWSNLLAISRTRFQCVLDSLRTALFQRFGS